jgi:hypothetical protein
MAGACRSITVGIHQIDSMSDQGQVIASQPDKTLDAIENGDEGEEIAENLQQAQVEVPRSQLDESLVRIDQKVGW